MLLLYTHWHIFWIFYITICISEETLVPDAGQMRGGGRTISHSKAWFCQQDRQQPCQDSWHLVKIATSIVFGFLLRLLDHAFPCISKAGVRQHAWAIFVGALTVSHAHQPGPQSSRTPSSDPVARNTRLHRKSSHSVSSYPWHDGWQRQALSWLARLGGKGPSVQLWPLHSPCWIPPAVASLPSSPPRTVVVPFLHVVFEPLLLSRWPSWLDVHQVSCYFCRFLVKRCMFPRLRWVIGAPKTV